MALLYTPAKVLFLAGSINLGSNTIKAILVKSSHAANAAHDYLEDVSADTEGTAATLGSKTTTAGVFDAANVTFTAVAAGDPVDRLLIYKHVTNGADSPVLALLDLASEITPDGGNIVVAFDAAGLFSFTE